MGEKGDRCWGANSVSVAASMLVRWKPQLLVELIVLW